jgi:HEAT repeat protein
VRRLRELARDRDRSVRARAVAAIGALDPAHPVRAVDDPVTEVRAAVAASATEAELRVLIADRAPEVRVAALGALGDRAADVVIRAAGDPSPSVRRAAIPLLGDLDALERLARDDSPEVATAALVRMTELRGRAALTSRLLERLVAAPPGSTERARIALAWLLAS